MLVVFLVFLLARITGFLLLLPPAPWLCQYGQAMAYLPDTVSKAARPVVPLLLCPDMQIGTPLRWYAFRTQHRVLWSLEECVCVWMAGERM